MGERDRKDTLRLNILRDTLGDNWYDNMSHILHNSHLLQSIYTQSQWHDAVLIKEMKLYKEVIKLVNDNADS